MELPRRWNDLSPQQQVSAVATGAVQLALAVTAWRDLAKRPASRVNGKKALWAVIIGVNFIGPIAYFAFGRRRD